MFILGCFIAPNGVLYSIAIPSLQRMKMFIVSELCRFIAMNVSVRIFIIAEVSNFILTTNRLEINIIDYPFKTS
jgi:hypothetical protein